jgi:hypothetical protein
LANLSDLGALTLRIYKHVYGNGTGEDKKMKMTKANKIFHQMRLRLLEKQIDQEFDRNLSLKIDRVHAQIEANKSQNIQETGFLAGAIKAIVKKAAVVALQWFQPKAILRAAQWKKKIINLLG